MREITNPIVTEIVRRCKPVTLLVTTFGSAAQPIPAQHTQRQPAVYLHFHFCKGIFAAAAMENVCCVSKGKSHAQNAVRREAALC